MENQKPAPFAALLRQFRLTAGLSQEALADRADLSSVSVSALERGTRRAPHRQTVALLADALLLAPPDRARLESAAVFAARPRNCAARADAAISPETRHDNLPLPLTSFHGRERDLEVLCETLQQRRLVTLRGVGGVGKTRLAIETARSVLSRFTEGVLLVELAAIVDPEMVPARIAAVVKVQEQPGRPLLETLTLALRERHLLLVIDNCEHLLDASATAVQRLLEGCAQLHVLATSREPLRVPGERLHAVAPLALPQTSSARLPSLEEFRQSPAIRLFFDRAADVAPPLALDDEAGRRSLLAICERLDGLPLAIELAAARTNALSLAALEAQLDDRFHLLSRGSRTAPARQQTLRATLDWSYALLSEPEQIAFRRLGIFAGGWTLEAAQAVCADGGAVAESDLTRLLDSLIEKSLIVADPTSARPRYRLLETMRAYALERSTEIDERDATAERHFAHFRRCAQEADETLGTVPMQVWLTPLRMDLDNIRAALRWAFGEGNCPVDGVALVAAFGWTFGRLSYYVEGRRWCERALQVLSSHSDLRREASVQLAMMVYLYYLGVDADVAALKEAAAAGKRAADLYRELNDHKGLAYALPWLGYIYALLGRREEGEELANEGIGFARALDERFRLSLGLHWKSCTVEKSAVDARRAILDEALDIAEALDDDVAVATAASGLGFVAAELGETAVAREYLLQSIAHFERVGYGAPMVYALGVLAWCSLAEGDTMAARDAARSAITRRAQLQANVSTSAALLTMCGVAVVEGAAPDGARLLGAAKQIHNTSGIQRQRFTIGAAAQEFILGLLRAALTESELQALMREGAAWSIERAFAEALRI